MRLLFCFKTNFGAPDAIFATRMRFLTAFKIIKGRYQFNLRVGNTIRINPRLDDASYIALRIIVEQLILLIKQIRQCSETCVLYTLIVQSCSYISLQIYETNFNVSDCYESDKLDNKKYFYLDQGQFNLDVSFSK